MHFQARHHGRSYAAGFNCNYLIYATVGKEACYFFAYLQHQFGVDLVIEEAIHFEHSSGEVFAFFSYALVENFHIFFESLKSDEIQI